MAWKKVKQGEVTQIQAYKTTDGNIYESKESAQAHQDWLNSLEHRKMVWELLEIDLETQHNQKFYTHIDGNSCAESPIDVCVFPIESMDKQGFFHCHYCGCPDTKDIDYTR